MTLTVDLNAQSKDKWTEIKIAAGLSAGAALALGLSRFSYGLLLPAMRSDMAWSYVEAGALNTANGAGYIIGALLAPFVPSRFGASRSFILGFVISVIVLLVSAGLSSFGTLFSVRVVGGISTAITFIVGAGLAAAISGNNDSGRKGTLIGIYVGGVGIGVFLGGVSVPMILRGGMDNWHFGWLALGLLGAAGLPFAWWASRQVFSSSGGTLPRLGAGEFRQIAPTFFGYGLFGAGYVGYMTFIIALLKSGGSSDSLTMWFWIVLGLVSAGTTLVWGRVLGALKGGYGPSIVFATSMVGTLLVLAFSDPIATFLSAVVFGGSFLAGPTAIAIVAQRQLKSASWTAAIALLTVAFAVGQTIGPVLAGFVSDTAGSIAAGFWVSPVLLGAAACINLMQKPSNDHNKK